MNKKVAKIFAKDKFYQFGIKIKIGRLTAVYWDPKAALSDPKALKVVAGEFAKIIKKIRPKIEVIAGGATGGISLAAATAMKLNLPWVYIRDKAKEYSTKKLVEGSYPKGANTVLLDDVIASGNAKKIFIDNAKEELKIKNILVILDDASGKYPEWIQEKNIKVQPLFTKSDRDEYYRKIKFFGDKTLKLEKAYEADRDNWYKNNANIELFEVVRDYYKKHKNFKI